jgi:uncharacterized protein (DUF58 family)
MTVLLLVSGFWAATSLIGIRVERMTRSNRKQVGEIIKENFEINNRSVFPKIWLKINDNSEVPGSAGSRVITWIGPRQIKTYVSYTLLQKRGWFNLGHTMVESGDLFNLFLVKKSFYSENRLLVQPYWYELNAFPAYSGIQPGGRALKQKTLDVTPYAAGVREFIPGDPLKRIHWPSSARQQKLIVKEFEKDPMAEVWIFFDASYGVHIHPEKTDYITLSETLWETQRHGFQLPSDTEEYAVTITASIAKYYIDQNREVGLVAEGRKFFVLSPERGERQLGKILETLAVLRADGNLPLWKLVSSQLYHLTKGATVILVTPSPDDQFLSIIPTLILRGLLPVVILIDQKSFGGNQESYDLSSKLEALGALVYLVKKGDDIKKVLETPQMVNAKKYFISRI